MNGADLPAARGWHQRYGELYAQLSAAGHDRPLEPDELERLAMAAYLVGRDAECVESLTRAHHGFLAQENPVRAARTAFWLSFTLIHQSERARAAGWIERARRLVEECAEPCVERGYLLLPQALQAVADRDLGRAEQLFSQAASIGRHFGDADLANLARQGQGRCLVNLGDIERGSALLDEVMVAVTGGEVSPFVAGTVYCSVIEACFDMFDVRRAHEWTEALTAWCASQPDLVPYRGHCLVRRAEIMEMHGAWADALLQARQACEALAAPRVFSPAALGGAFYEVAELHRLRGEFTRAEAHYRLAGESGRAPQPGLALLRLAQGKVDAAKAAIGRVLEELQDRRQRTIALAAGVEILIRAGEVAGARRAADELSALASTLGTPYPRALAAHAAGHVLLEEGDPKAAIRALREACAAWRELDAPYPAACVTVLIALACRALGDEDCAQLEAGTARKTFQQLGAQPDLDRLETFFPLSTRSGDGLTTRELQVLRLVASGKTNRAVAQALKISEKTVARHLNNIFTKLDVPSRAAATAYAYQHKLV